MSDSHLATFMLPSPPGVEAARQYRWLMLDLIQSCRPSQSFWLATACSFFQQNWKDKNIDTHTGIVRKMQRVYLHLNGSFVRLHAYCTILYAMQIFNIVIVAGFLFQNKVIKPSIWSSYFAQYPQHYIFVVYLTMC